MKVQAVPADAPIRKRHPWPVSPARLSHPPVRRQSELQVLVAEPETRIDETIPNTGRIETTRRPGASRGIRRALQQHDAASAQENRIATGSPYGCSSTTTCGCNRDSLIISRILRTGAAFGARAAAASTSKTAREYIPFNQYA